MSESPAEKPTVKAEGTASGPPLHLSPNQKAWRRFKRNRMAVISSWFLAGLLLVVIGWPITLKLAGASGPKGKVFAAEYDPTRLSDLSFEPPTAKHWFGTDVHGRD